MSVIRGVKTQPLVLAQDRTPPAPPAADQRSLSGWLLDALTRLGARSPQDVLLIAPEHLTPADLVDRLEAALTDVAPRTALPCALHRCHDLSDLRRCAQSAPLSPADRRHVLVAMDDGPDPVESGIPHTARAVARDLGVPALIVVTSEGWDELDDLGPCSALLPGTAVVDARPAPGSKEIVDYLRAAAERLEQYHGVSIPEPTIGAAAAAVPGKRDPSQPALGESLLDLWACRGALLGRRRILPPEAAEAAEDTGRGASRRGGPGREAVVGLDVEALFESLSSRVLGQEEACRTVATQVALGACGLRLVADRPRSALLLAGGTGTGKTLLARTLAERVGEGAEPLIRVDMGSLTSDHLGAALLGSPPGYVGSEDRDDWLTTRIRRSPRAVLLLDEVDKAAPVLRDALLLEILGNGTLTDYSGRTVDASGLHVVLTANTGARALTRSATGFGDDEDRRRAAETEIRRLLPPEVFNRLDAVVLMNNLTRPRMAGVLDAVLADLSRVAAAAGYELEVGARARELLLDEAVSRPDGARRLQRTVEQALAAPLLGRPAGTYRASVRAGGIAVVACEERRTCPAQAG